MTSHPLPSEPWRLFARLSQSVRHLAFPKTSAESSSRWLTLSALMLAFTVVAAAQISVAPLNRTVGSAAGSSSFQVTTTPALNVPWVVESEGSADTPDPSWIEITSTVNFIGSGTVTFDYEENATTLPRTNRFRCTRTDTQENVIFEFIQEPPDQTAILTPSTIAIEGFGGTRDIAVQVAPAGTPWTATTLASWIQILSAPTNGDGTLKIRILSNTTGVQRVGDVFVLNSKVRVTQTSVDATFSLNPTSNSVPATAGNGAVGVTVSVGSPAWTAASNADWLTVTNGPNYTGNATVNYSFAANASNDPRQGTLTIAGQTFTVTQAGADDEPPPPADSLVVSPSSLSFTLNLGGGASTLSRSVSISSSGDPLNFSSQIHAGNGGNWLSVNPSSGSTPQSVQFNASQGSLQPGVYTATVVVSAAGATSVNVPATFTINPPGNRPTLPAVPTSLYFSRTFGGALPGAQRVRLSGPGVVLNATASFESNVWLSVAVTSDASGTYVSTSIRDVNLLPAIYDSAITVKSTDFQFADLVVPVRYVVNLAGVSGPKISSGGISNGATFAAGGAPGTWISIFGTGLASVTQNWNPSTVNGALLPTNVGGTEVFVGGVRAAISYVSPTQVNALVPGIPDRGWVPVEVRANNQSSELGYLWVADRSPAFFVYSPLGGKYPAAQHGDTKPVGPPSFVPGARPAKALEAIAIYGTGFGPTNPATDPSRFFSGAAPLANPQDVSVTVGGLNAAVEFVGLVAPGLYQLNVKLAALPVGEHPILVRIGTYTTQVGIVIIIEQ